jgi:hypothetical protein
MVTLYTSYYKDKSEVRQKELDYCLNHNLENPLIDRIMLYCDEGAEVSHPKVTLLGKKRPTYKDFFDAINMHVKDKHEVSIISNTDIYFDETLKLIKLQSNKACFALSRWDVKPGQAPKLHNERYSQDVWIFTGKIRNIRNCDFNLGIPGCDNRIAWELNRGGYFVKNPAHSIKTYHYHPSDLHNYTDAVRISKPYLFVELT